jgi:hypothetical protein
MHDPLLVGFVDRAGDLLGNADDLSRRKRTR